MNFNLSSDFSTTSVPRVNLLKSLIKIRYGNFEKLIFEKFLIILLFNLKMFELILYEISSFLSKLRFIGIDKVFVNLFLKGFIILKKEK